MSKKVGFLIGSLRGASYTRKIAEAMMPLFPEGYEPQVIEIGHLPHFNQDYDDGGALPESYIKFRELIDGYDAFVFATPEYNRSIPAVLKNALDVASRPYGKSKWNDKPAAVVSVSPGRVGGFGANHHLRQVLSFLNMKPVQQPEAYIGLVGELLDKDGKVTDPAFLELLQQIVDKLVSMTL